jgi:hypothetical protein
VCHSGIIFSRSATVSGSPGTTAVPSATNSASTCGVRTGAASAGAARRRAATTVTTQLTRRATGRTARGIESLVALRRWKFRAADDERMTPGLDIVPRLR